MDTEHRHELKTNELVNLLTHFPQFLKNNANMLIGIGLIVIGLVTWPLFSRMKQQKVIAEDSKVSKSIQLIGQDIMAALGAYREKPDQLNPALDTILVNANALMELTSETDNPNLEALAYIKAAQAIRTELQLRKDMVNAETVDAQIQKAQDAYEKASNVAVMPTMKAMAQFGLGLCAEERGQTQQAAEIYSAITKDESFAATVFPAQAQSRLDALRENAESFTFVEAEPAQIEEAPVAPAAEAPQVQVEQPATDAPVAPTAPAAPAVPAVPAAPAESAPPAAETEAAQPAGQP